MEPYRCLQGVANKSLETDHALWRLAQDASATPAVAEALLSGTPAEALDALDRSPEGRAWRARFEAFLGEYGDRAQALELASPTWIEEPVFAVENLRRYLTADASDPEAQRESAPGGGAGPRGDGRASADRRRPRAARPRSTTRTRSPSPTGPSRRTTPSTSISGPSPGATRRAFLRLASSLTAQGRIADFDDVWYLDFDALRDGLAGADLTSARERADRGTRRTGCSTRPLCSAPRPTRTPLRTRA